jgi:hypothetical protein
VPPVMTTVLPFIGILLIGSDAINRGIETPAKRYFQIGWSEA